MKNYELIIKNEKAGQYRLLATLIVLINLVLFIWLAITNTELRIKGLITLALIIGGFVLQHFTRKYSAGAASVFFIILFYFESGYWQAAIIMAALALMYMVAVRKLVVLVNTSHVQYPSFPKKEIAWNELNNLILKDGLLTIDLKSNKISQATVVNGAVDHDIDEKEFNEFCQKQLDIQHVMA